MTQVGAKKCEKVSVDFRDLRAIPMSVSISGILGKVKSLSLT